MVRMHQDSVEKSRSPVLYSLRDLRNSIDHYLSNCVEPGMGLQQEVEEINHHINMAEGLIKAAFVHLTDPVGVE